MHETILARATDTARYMLNHRSTVREAARHMHVSKTTVHKDMRVRLPKIDRELARQIAALLDEHLSLRHLRGGEATRQKYRR